MHIHIPDGVLPIWLWVSGYLISTFLFLILSTKLREKSKIPRVATVSAFMLVSMSIPLGVPTHINLAAFAGIILGPYWAFISSFVVNLILASIGHGGITIVGLNTIVVWMESLIAYLSFSLLKRISKNCFMNAAISTFLALLASLILVVLIVVISNVDPRTFLHHHEHQAEAHYISIPTFISTIAPISIFGAIVESLITGLLISYIKKVKPELLP